MLDMGFIPDIEKIFKLTPFTRQVLFFSATMPAEIKRLVDQFLHQPVTIQVARQSTTAETVRQRIIRSPLLILSKNGQPYVGLSIKKMSIMV